jgi:hypothetical protein
VLSPGRAASCCQFIASRCSNYTARMNTVNSTWAGKVKKNRVRCFGTKCLSAPTPTPSGQHTHSCARGRTMILTHLQAVCPSTAEEKYVDQTDEAHLLLQRLDVWRLSGVWVPEMPHPVIQRTPGDALG